MAPTRTVSEKITGSTNLSLNMLCRTGIVTNITTLLSTFCVESAGIIYWQSRGSVNII